MEPQSIRALAKWFQVDRSAIDRLLLRSELPPDKIKGKTKYFDPQKICQLLLSDVKDRSYQQGFKDGQELSNLEDDPDGDGTPAHQKPNHPDYEKWRHTRAQADKLELDNAERRGYLIPLEPIIQRDRIVASSQAQLFDSLVVRIKRKVPDVSDKILEVIVDIVSKCRNELKGLIEERQQELQLALESQGK